MREDGRGLEVSEEDDELLRAAEELGVDLSPDRLRATGRAPDAEEVETGAERLDEGELTLANDETLDVVSEDEAPRVGVDLDGTDDGYLDAAVAREEVEIEE
jgi:DNA-directed RNA polymerase subunit beta